MVIALLDIVALPIFCDIIVQIRIRDVARIPDELGPRTLPPLRRIKSGEGLEVEFESRVLEPKNKIRRAIGLA